MSRKVIVLWGPPGSGKTWLRTHDSVLKTLPVLDIADIYREHERRFPEFGPLEAYAAHCKLHRLIREILTQKSTIVVEGCFMEDSPSRKMLQDDARVGGYALEFVQCQADPEVCHQRIMAQYEAKEVDWATTDARLRILQYIAEQA